MDKNEFMATGDMRAFVQWLVEHLPTMRFALRFPASRFVPGGINENVTGIEKVLSYYKWRSSWDDEGVPVPSETWVETVASLEQLRMRLRAAIEQDDKASLHSACLQVLAWGGVSGARAFLRQKFENRTLRQYLCSVERVLRLDENTDLANINENAIQQFDAGLTKIHSLIDVTGSPIYDSRVGAAIAMLYALYRQNATHPSVWSFPSGAARGAPVRDPGDLGLLAAPQFYTRRVSHVKWAQSQLVLGWILRAMLDQSPLFQSLSNDITRRCHALEATLFMIGYDLRCFETYHGATISQPRGQEQNKEPNNHGWVPAGHPFPAVLSHFRAFLQHPGNEELVPNERRQRFVIWLQNLLGLAPGAANAYCFPLRASEFEFFTRPLWQVNAICAAIEHQDVEQLAVFLNEYALDADERRNVCLVDAWAVGNLAERGLTPAQRNQVLIQANFAGTLNAAATLVYVGTNVGQALSLLDQDSRPTAFFRRAFDGKMTELQQQLDAALAALNF